MHLCLALVTFLVTATSAAHPQVEIMKARILADLGMTRPPDMSAVNTSESEMQRMMREYEMRVRESEEEEERVITPDDVMIYDRLACINESHVLFHPVLSNDTELISASLLFPDNTTRDITTWVQQWLQFDDLKNLPVTCKDSYCCRTRLELKVRRLHGLQPTCIKECCLRSFNVTFEELGWSWVLSPHYAEFYYCKGNCWKLTDHFSSWHAVIQSIYSFNNANNRGNIPLPCCTPTKLKPMNILYFDGSDPPRLSLKKMKDMIVQECGCV